MSVPPSRDFARDMSETRDGADRPPTELSLRRERDVAMALIEGAPVVMVLLDLEGRIQFVNPFYEQLTGYALEDIRGKDWFATCLPARDRDRMGALFRVSLGGVPTGGNVNPVVTRDGEERDIEWYDRLMRNDAGEPTGLLAIGQDVTERRRAERRARETARLQRAVFDSMFGFVGLFTPEGVVVDVNRASLEAAGVDRGAVIGQLFWETYWWADDAAARDQARDAIRRAARGEIVREDFRVRVGDDRCVTFDGTFRAIRDGEGTVTHVVGSGVDITDRLRIETALAASEARLTEAQRIAQIGNWELDLVANVLHWSDQVYRIFAIDKSRFGASYEAFLFAVHPDDRAAVDAAYARSVATREPYDFTHRLRLADGRITHVRERGESVYDEAGRAIRSVGTVQDVTAELLARESLWERERLFRALFEGGDVGVMLISPDGLVQEVNDAYLRLLGARRGDVVGAGADALARLTHPDDLRDSQAEVRALLDGDLTSSREEKRYLRGDGSTVWALLSRTAIRDAAGTLHAVVAQAVDITTRKEAEERSRRTNEELDQRIRERTSSLEAANRDLEAFTYSVSHDLKAPLRGIDGYSRLLLVEHGDALDDEGRRCLLLVRQAAGQMHALIEDLLAYSRLDRRAFAIASVDPGAVVEDVLAERGRELDARRVVVRRTLACRAVATDREALAIVVRNLLDNAVKFTREVADPAIEVGGRDTDTACTLWVKDNGIGFDPQYHDRIFEMFQRLQRQEDYPGTGVGLAMVRRAVSRIGGRVWAESAPGSGATFWVEIPR